MGLKGKKEKNSTEKIRCALALAAGTVGGCKKRALNCSEPLPSLLYMPSVSHPASAFQYRITTHRAASTGLLLLAWPGKMPVTHHFRSTQYELILTWAEIRPQAVMSGRARTVRPAARNGALASLS